MLPRHKLNLVLVHPQIAPNTGNIARLCVATGTRLHLVRPMGFVLDDRQLRRSAMDYWPRLDLVVHDDLPAFLAAAGGARQWLFDSEAGRPLWTAEFAEGDFLLMGSETRGLSAEMLAGAGERALAIPQVPGPRCLNLSTAAGVVVYEAIRQIARG